MSEKIALPESWKDYIPLVTSLVRWFLAAAGSAGVMWAQTVTADQTTQIVGILMMAASGVWSIVQKFQAAKALRVAAANPAGATAPNLPA